ncbi:hypothetical protein Tco_0454223 [Tanacetum coccineum]
MTIITLVWDVHRLKHFMGESVIHQSYEQKLGKDNFLQIKDRLKATCDHQKSYADRRRKPLEFSVGDHVLLKVSPWKGVIRFGKKGKLAPRFVGPFEITKRIGPVAYRLRLPEELNGVHDTFYVSDLKKLEILGREFKKLKRSRIPIVKVRLNSKRGPEFTWGREDQMKLKYPHLFSASDIIVELICEDILEGAYFEAKTKTFEDYPFLTNTPYPGKEIRRISAKSSQENAYSQFPIRRIHLLPYAEEDDLEIVYFGIGLHSKEEMAEIGFGAYWSGSERVILDKGDLRDYWMKILSDRDFLGPVPSYVHIRDPVRRLCHRMIACSISSRGQEAEKVTRVDLFYLRTMDHETANVPYLLAQYLFRHAKGRKSGASLLGSTSVQGLAIRPERQQAAAAGAHGGAEDAPIADEGAQAVPAPVQAPQPPPPAPQPLTMFQRIDRLDEEVRELRQSLVGLRGVVESLSPSRLESPPG